MRKNINPPKFEKYNPDLSELDHRVQILKEVVIELVNHLESDVAEELLELLKEV